jgi:transposase
MTDASPEFEALRTALAAAEARAVVAEARASAARAMVSGKAAVIATLKLEIEKLKRALYGQKSERRARLLDQLELRLEELEAAATEDDLAAEQAAAQAKTAVRAFERRRPARKPFPAHLPRERVVIEAPAACGCCGSERIVKMGEDGEPLSAIGPRTMASETLEVIPRQWKVIQTVREKVTCRHCEKITQPPAPFHPTPRGWAGPSLLAVRHGPRTGGGPWLTLFEKFGQHQPLNRQAERYAREGVELSLSTLADQVGACAAALAPLHALIEAHVMAAGRLHEDSATRRAIVPLGNGAGFDQERFDDLDAHASLLRRGGDGMQAALSDDFADQRLPGRDGPMIEDALAQDAAEQGEPGLPQVVPAQGGIHRAENLARRIEMPRGRRRDAIEGRADGALAAASDVEAGRVIGAGRAIRVTKFSRTKGAPQEPTEGRRGEQGLILEQGLVPAVLNPLVEPEIVGGGGHRRPVEGSRQDVFFDLASRGYPGARAEQADRDLVPGVRHGSRHWSGAHGGRPRRPAGNAHPPGGAPRQPAARRPRHPLPVATSSVRPVPPAPRPPAW